MLKNFNEMRKVNVLPYCEKREGISYKSPTGDIVNCEHDAIGNMAVAFVGTSGVQMGWLASQADMLAEDWVFA